MEPEIERKTPAEPSPEKERRAGPDEPGRTPDRAEGGELGQGREKPYPGEPGKTPGRAEG